MMMNILVCNFIIKLVKILLQVMLIWEDDVDGGIINDDDDSKGDDDEDDDEDDEDDVAHCCAIFLCEIDDHHRTQNINDRDHLVISLL